MSSMRRTHRVDVYVVDEGVKLVEDVSFPGALLGTNEGALYVLAGDMPDPT